MHRDSVRAVRSAKGNFWLDSALENRTIGSLTPPVCSSLQEVSCAENNWGVRDIVRINAAEPILTERNCKIAGLTPVRFSLQRNRFTVRTQTVATYSRLQSTLRQD